MRLIFYEAKNPLTNEITTDWIVSKHLITDNNDIHATIDEINSYLQKRVLLFHKLTNMVKLDEHP